MSVRPVRFRNTLGRRVEEFVPLRPAEVRLYTCGPTVYNYAHIGNLRTFLFEDLLKRSLTLLGYRVLHVMNLTDVDDKTIRGAQEKGVSLAEFTAPYVESFHADLAALGVVPADQYPRATDPASIAKMHEIIARNVRTPERVAGAEPTPGPIARTSSARSSRARSGASERSR